jgi:hypothetical protein
MGISHAPARHPPDHRAGSRRGPRLVVVALAALTFAVPLPDAVLAAWRRAYAAFQPVVTSLSGALPIATLDIVILASLVWTAIAVWRWRRRRRAAVRASAPVDLVLRAATLVATGWLAFLGLWGWHYQVPTLEARLAVQPAELTAERGEAFARTVVEALNLLHAEAHASGWADRQQVAALVGPHVARVLPTLGVAWTAVWPSPRQTMLDGYFRAAGVDGMTNPFGLEVLVNTHVLPMELPALAGHEFAHLAGFADESDASVVAWLACQTGGAGLRYSAALAVLPHVLTGMARPARQALLQALDAGPRRDLQAISARLAEQRPWVHAFAWQTYDGFLKANRVGEGVARYDAVARVLVGVADPVTGRLRRSPSAWPSGHR